MSSRVDPEQPRARAASLRATWLPALALLAAALVAYVPALRGDFLWDDPAHVSENAALETPGGLWRIWFEIGATQQYYPLTFTSFWLERRVFGLDPAGYHVTNIVLHALSGMLLWRLLRRLAVPCAWVAAAVFVLHPVQVESVAWISERKNVLSTSLYLLAASAWVRFALPRDGERLRPGLAYGLALLCFVGAMFAKTVTCTFPAAAALVLWWKKGRLERRDLVPLAPFFAVGLALAFVTLWAEKTLIGAQGEAFELSLLDRVVLAGRIPWFYVGKLVWPAELSFVYPRWSIDASLPWQFSFALALLALLAFLAWRRTTLGRGPLVAVLFFVGSLFPALGFVDVYPMRFSFVADHFQYLATLGMIPLLVAGAARLLGRSTVPRLAPVLSALLLAALGTLTFARSRAFRDSETLWRDTLAKNPGAWVAHSNLSTLHFTRGRFDEAIAEARRALELEAALPEAHVVIGAAHFSQKRFAEAAEAYVRALAVDPNYWRARSNLADTLSRLGRLEEARTQYEAALALVPDNRDVLRGLALLHESRGELADAARLLRAARRLAPDEASTALRLVRVLAADPTVTPADLAEAVTHAEGVVAGPLRGDPETLARLAAALERARVQATETGQVELARELRAQLDRLTAGAGTGRPRQPR